MNPIKKLTLALPLVFLSLSGCRLTEQVDRPYTGVHDDTLGLHNSSIAPDEAPIQKAQPNEVNYAEAGPGGMDSRNSYLRPSGSSGGAGAWNGAPVAEDGTPPGAAPAEHEHEHGS